MRQFYGYLLNKDNLRIKQVNDRPAKEFAPHGDKPPPARAVISIGLLDALVWKAADFVPRYKVSRFVFRRLGYQRRAPPL